MHLLYDSDQYVVVHFNANAHDNPLLSRDGFELVDKHRAVEVYLDGAMANAFQKRIDEWAANIPAQEDVEAVLEGFLLMAHIPVLQH